MRVRFLWLKVKELTVEIEVSTAVYERQAKTGEGFDVR